MVQASANINIMIKAARQAGRALLRDFGEVENLQVTSKSAGDFVSRADHKSEQTIRETLMEARPNYGFLGEESGETKGTDPTRRWIVDPLDGTTNFLHGMPHWSVSIALEHKKEIVAAVVFDPVKDEIHVAEKGSGTWMNDRRMRVTSRSELIETVMATGSPFANSPNLPKHLQEVAKLSPTCAGIRRWGAASLDLAFVAAGRFDVFWERGLKPWDIAAGLLLVREAGGLAAPLVEGDDLLTGAGLMVSNEKIHDRVLTMLRSV